MGFSCLGLLNSGHLTNLLGKLCFLFLYISADPSYRRKHYFLNNCCADIMLGALILEAVAPQAVS